MVKTGLSRVVFFSAMCLSVSALLQAVDRLDRSFIRPLDENTTIVSTIPPNGDINPYGVAVVPTTTGKLVSGNILVSNFNNSQNFQGTGKTIVFHHSGPEIPGWAWDGKPRLFFQCLHRSLTERRRIG